MATSAPTPYSEDAAYKQSVIKMMSAATASLPDVVPGLEQPAVSCLRYHHLGLAAADVAASEAFYARLGFARLPGGDPAAAKGPGILRLGHSCGLELHLIQADCAADPPTNVLMDTDGVKYPGHTHASWSVQSVPGVKDFLASLGISPSGLRSTLAVFVRDPDRTTLEFERNDGGDDRVEAFTPAMIGHGKPLDHVGTRLRGPFDRHLDWYAKVLGFNKLVRRYEPNPEPLKNNPPWVTRTAHGCDINWIINCNTPVPEAGEQEENILCEGGVLKPGILYAGFAIDEPDVAAAAQRLRAAGAVCCLDSELGTAAGAAAVGALPAGVVRALEGGPTTLLLRDLNGNLLRLVPAKL